MVPATKLTLQERDVAFEARLRAEWVHPFLQPWAFWTELIARPLPADVLPLRDGFKKETWHRMRESLWNYQLSPLVPLWARSDYGRPQPRCSPTYWT